MTREKCRIARSRVRNRSNRQFPGSSPGTLLPAIRSSARFGSTRLTFRRAQLPLTNGNSRLTGFALLPELGTRGGRLQSWETRLAQSVGSQEHRRLADESLLTSDIRAQYSDMGRCSRICPKLRRENENVSKLLTLRQVIEKVSLSKALIYKLIRKGLFPCPRNLSPGRVGWLEDEVDSWVEARPPAGTVPPADTA